MPITIRDVAKAAGVSITTASRALNGFKDVKPTTRDRVRKVADELNYQPNSLARGLVTQRSRTIGLLVSDLTKDRDGHHFMFDVWRGLYSGFSERGYDVSLVSTNTARQSLVSYVDFCRQRQFDGVIVMGIRSDDPYVHEVAESPLPSVVIDLPLLSEHCGYVMSDNVSGGRNAVRHLVERGHRNLAMVNGHSHAIVSQDRLRGFQDGLRLCGIEFQPERVLEGDFTMASGEQCMEVIREQFPDVTAVFFANDLMALGALRYITGLGLNVPNQIAIIGYDDVDLAQLVHPALTTVAQPRFEMGSQAAHMLISMLEDDKEPHGCILPSNLVIRGST